MFCTRNCKKNEDHAYEILLNISIQVLQFFPICEKEIINHAVETKVHVEMSERNRVYRTGDPMDKATIIQGSFAAYKWMPVSTIYCYICN